MFQWTVSKYSHPEKQSQIETKQQEHGGHTQSCILSVYVRSLHLLLWFYWCETQTKDMTPILTVVSDTLLKQLLQNIVVHDNTSLLPITWTMQIYIKH